MQPKSKPIFVYLQLPGTIDWVTVGAYANQDGVGYFRYAPQYLARSDAQPLDPFGLPLGAAVVEAQRYAGLHDVLRDACPDDWGKTLLRRQHALPDNTPDWCYLLLSSNADRWGALAFGSTPKPSPANAQHPKLHQLNDVVLELQAMSEGRPAVDAGLRRRLMQTPSMGGARPKATVRDQDAYWLVKPWIQTDIEDTPALEHATHCWGRDAGLNLAETVLHPLHERQSVVRVRRFDRNGAYRHRVLSAATLLKFEYPARGAAAGSTPAYLTYGHLADQLRYLGVPVSDLQELFGRMVFNFIVGNDDDHPRNHAALYSSEEQRWRLSPGFDIVPNDAHTPTQLYLGPSPHRPHYSRQGVLAEYRRFGFARYEDAVHYLDALLARLESTFVAARLRYPARWRPVIDERVAYQLRVMVTAD